MFVSAGDFGNHFDGIARHRYAAGSHDFRSIEENHFIHNAGFESGAVELCARFEEDVEDLMFAEIAQDCVEIDVATFGGTRTTATPARSSARAFGESSG